MSDESTEPIPSKATSDVTSKRSGLSRLRPNRPVAIFLGILAGCLVLSAGGAAYATYEYGERYEGRTLPGTMIAGTEVGGLERKQAIKKVRAALADQLDRNIEVTYKDRTWTVTPRKLGAHGNAGRVVDEAISLGANSSFLEKMRLKFFEDDAPFERSVAITYPRQGVRGFVEGLSSSFDREAKDATIDYSTGWVEMEKEQSGREIQTDKTRRALSRALKTGGDKVALAVKEIQPEKTTEDFGQILLLRIGENKLYLYDEGKITHEYTVATGQPEYPTPTGVYSITEKRYLPTWVNPDPTGWGASMPESIPPGPGNPLGTRALNWSAPAIRFHGTQATYSLGYNASHGCVRMSMPDVEELYELVEVGTTIVSTTVSGYKPLYDSSPDPIVVEEDAADPSGGGNKRDD